MCSLLSVSDCLLTLSDSFCRFTGTLCSPLGESFLFRIRGSLISGTAGISPFLWACGDLCSKRFGCRPLGEESEGGSGKMLVVLTLSLSSQGSVEAVELFLVLFGLLHELFAKQLWGFISRMVLFHLSLEIWMAVLLANLSASFAAAIAASAVSEHASPCSTIIVRGPTMSKANAWILDRVRSSLAVSWVSLSFTIWGVRTAPATVFSWR